jgi:DNA end-binding protein Ku
MPRAMWTGAISFGMVTVPVKLYSALDRKAVRFHQLSGKTGTRISQKRIDPQTGEEVAYEDVVKGYEIAKDRYVVIEPGELEALEPKKTKTIEIEDFVELSQIDPVYYDHPYYLAPGPGGVKPYRLLLEAMRQTGKVAIARVVIRSKEQLVAVRPMGEALGMATMIFADEVIAPERLDEIREAAEVKTTKRELEMAEQLVSSLAGDFEPDKYRDSYRQEILDLIERKAQGKEIAVQPAREEVAQPAPDLMSALKASLEAVRAREGEQGATDAKATKTAAKKPARKAAKKPAAAKASAKKPGTARRPAKR